jgi:preprotein translocase subunit Sec61beta
MANDKVRMPSSTAGITSYYDEFKGKFVFKPGHIVIMVVIVILIEIFLHLQGYSLIGITQ